MCQSFYCLIVINVFISHLRCNYAEPLDLLQLSRLTNKSFAPETIKKIEWVIGMFTEWCNYCNSLLDMDFIHCAFAMCHFITEIKKLDGTDLPPKTMCVSLSSIFQSCLPIGLRPLKHKKALQMQQLASTKFVPQLGICVKKLVLKGI